MDDVAQEVEELEDQWSEIADPTTEARTDACRYLPRVSELCEAFSRKDYSGWTKRA